MRWGIVAFFLGTWCSLSNAIIPSLAVLIGCSVLTMAMLYVAKTRLIGFFLFGLLAPFWSLYSLNQQSLDPQLESRIVSLQGTVASIPKVNQRSQSFEFLVDELAVDNQVWRSPKRIRLTWYQTDITLMPGQVWSLQAKLKRPYGLFNEGGFDYESWLFRHGIRAVGYVYKHAQLEGVQGQLINRIRYTIAKDIDHYLPAQWSAIVRALSLGDRSKLSPEQRDLIRDTGISHLFAISALHLGMIAGFVYLVVFHSCRMVIPLTSYMPAQYYAAVLSFVGALTYAALAGFSLPTQRALIMIALVLLKLHLGYRLSFLNTILIAAGVIILWDPLALLAADFWLSFFAVLMILYVTEYRHHPSSWFNYFLYIQLVMSIAMLPLVAFWFHQVPIYAIMTNLIAVPFVVFILLPAVLLTVTCMYVLPDVASFMFNIIIWLLQWFWMLLQNIATLPFATVPIYGASWFNVLLALLGVLILFQPRGLKYRYLAIFLFLPMLYPAKNQLDHQEFSITLLDVGQALSVLVQTDQHVLLYDSGARFSDRFNASDAVIIPVLKRSAISQLDKVIISHGDNDHIGGMTALAQAITIQEILTSVPQRLQKHHAKPCQAGQSWQWDGVQFDIIHPPSDYAPTGNNASCVLHIYSSYGSVLLTGDIEKKAEQLIIKQLPQLSANIMVVPHHGSRTSSTPLWVKQVKPELALFPVGYKNRYGFPHAEVLERYQHYGAKTLISYKTGALTVHIKKTGISHHAYRHENRRFWHTHE